MKVTELEGIELDYWVAMAMGFEADFTPNEHPGNYRAPSCGWFNGTDFSPSTNWAQGGPIIEKHIYTLRNNGSSWHVWIKPGVGEPITRIDGTSALVTAMRAFVWSKFGSEVPSTRGITVTSGSIKYQRYVDSLPTKRDSVHVPSTEP